MQIVSPSYSFQRKTRICWWKENSRRICMRWNSYKEGSAVTYPHPLKDYRNKNIITKSNTQAWTDPCKNEKNTFNPPCFWLRTRAKVSCSHALTVASFKSTCGSVEGEISPSGVNVGAGEHGPGTSETKTQQESSMTCIFTWVELERPSLNTWRWKFWLMGKSFKWLLWVTEAEGSLRQCCGIREGFAESRGHRKNNSFIVMWQCLVSISASYGHEMQIQGWNQSFD